MSAVASTLLARIEEHAARTEGTVGVSATHVPTGAHIGVREDELFPTASVVKLPLLVALFREVNAGRIDLAQRVPYRAAQRVPGSGVLQDLDDGIEPTIRDLATLMTVVSDNTATDLLLDRVGKAAVEENMRALGLRSIRVPHTIREMLTLPWKIDPRAADAYERVRAAWHEHPEGAPAPIPVEEADRATPADLCALFVALERREIPEADAIIEILKRQKSDSRIPALLPSGTIVAHKTGTIRGVRNDCGIVYAPSGPLVIAIMSKGVRSDVRTDVELAEISLAVYEELAS
jgi:beta-lactamase class A